MASVVLAEARWCDHGHTPQILVTNTELLEAAKLYNIDECVGYITAIIKVYSYLGMPL
jgi:hypothetical protein